MHIGKRIIILIQLQMKGNLISIIYVILVPGNYQLILLEKYKSFDVNLNIDCMTMKKEICLSFYLVNILLNKDILFNRKEQK